MSPVNYLNEHLWIHYTGHFLVLLAFFSAAYVVAIGLLNKFDLTPSWIRAVKIAFLIHIASVFSVIGLILYMMRNHYYEFEYVWAHVSDELPMKYILSAFWEGQEGSFLLWMFWNCILGIYFFRQVKSIPITVLVILIGVNAILTSMLLGIHIGETKIGSSPFNLLRYTMDIPLFANADYVSLLKGNGLNPLLQNYWMIIHPPTLFLGFASTVIPYAYACAALIHRNSGSWLSETLPWSLISGFVLGTGILMGGAWAYEALSFGGYWAWDPVENMSLVPWLILVAAIHTNLIAKATGHSIKPTLILYSLSFIFVCYSSFLTRSGILGDSSAHAFTQMGLEWQLVALCVACTLFPFYLFFKNHKFIEVPAKEEEIQSREFWMFIGSLVLLFSALLISFTTSIPVYNKLLDLAASILGTDFTSLHRSIPLDPVAHHNQFQLWCAVFISIISGIALFLRYNPKDQNGRLKLFFIRISKALLLSGLIAFAVQLFSFQKLHWSHYLFLFAAWFSIIASAWYFISLAKGNFSLAASVISHGGFGLLLLGILFTGINKQILSTNIFAQEGLLDSPEAEELSKHLTLIRNEPMFMNGYWVEYSTDTFLHKVRKYTLKFWHEDSLGHRKDSFLLYPEIQYDNKLTKVAASNPSILRNVHEDIFSLVAQIPQSQVDVESAKQAEDSLRFSLHFLQLNDSLESEDYVFTLKNLKSQFYPVDFELKPMDQLLQMELDVKRKSDGKIVQSTPAILFRENLIYKFPSKLESFGVRTNIPDTLYSTLVPAYTDLRKNNIQLKSGGEITIENGIRIKLVKLNRNVPEELMKASGADVGVSALLELHSVKDTQQIECFFFIRGNQIISLPVSNLFPGISLRFMKINPQTEEMSFEYGLHPDPVSVKLPLEISENDVRTDFIVIQVIRFPWINLVWLGSIFMVLGMLIGAYQRRKVLTHVV
ncbi:MAG: cytochrome c biogenesis protein CcsA [Saprospiraceae bacterium]|nr:cytochrome c biogenesis protein CcsA [Saprospiraceae bacterium]